MDHRSLVFASVFPVPSLSHTTPTPIATPDLGHASFGQSFGGHGASSAAFASNATGGQHQQQRAIRRNLAWSTATRFLSLPRTDTGVEQLAQSKWALRTQEVEEALEYLLVGEGQSEDGNEQGLVEWYTNEATLHFASVVRPVLMGLWEKEIPKDRAWETLDEACRILEQAQSFYSQPFNDHVVPFLEQLPSSFSTVRGGESGDQRAEVEITVKRFRRDIHAVFAHCLPGQRFSKTLSYVLYETGCNIFSIHLHRDGRTPTKKGDSAFWRQRLIKILQSLYNVGLGADNAQKAFAHSMDKLMDAFISSQYVKVDWFTKKSIVPHLRMFIRDGFCPLVELVLECLRCESSTVHPTELQSWQEMALGRLGRARVNHLFDFVLNWDKTAGAIRDIKEYLKLPGAKQHLTTSFAQQVSRRLLHPGATTAYVLNVYISIIRTFHELEPKGVLLERVARPIRRYLKEREDTARIIISSLLTDVNEDTKDKFAASGDLSYEIASEMAKPLASFHREADDELDWNDMNWQPLPSDASPEYKKSKVEDVIWFLLTLWERDDFINELKNIFGDHLLRCEDPEYEKEIRLLEMIKIRLGDDKLQACEVMLRDVLDSKRINVAVKVNETPVQTPDQRMRLRKTPNRTNPRTPRTRNATASASALTSSAPHADTEDQPILNAQILSSFFWPPLRDDHFLVPAEIQALQQEYEARFERVKGMRKLRWMNALGDTTITLELEDRTQTFKKLSPWQVSVIYAFQPQGPEEEQQAAAHARSAKSRSRGRAAQAEPIARSIEQLEEMLQMDESLIHHAITFWIGQSILTETSPGSNVYTVLENLSTSPPSPSTTAAAAAAQEIAQVANSPANAVRSQADLLAEKKGMYGSFMLGMLTNQGNMPVGRILMMMRVMIQGGFPFGEEEVRGLLGEMEKEGRVVGLGGNVWGLRKG